LSLPHMIAVGLDVFEIEPRPEASKLRGFDNVLLSPHISDVNHIADRLVTERCVSNILEYLGGRSQAIAPCVDNPQVLAG